VRIVYHGYIFMEENIPQSISVIRRIQVKIYVKTNQMCRRPDSFD